MFSELHNRRTNRFTKGVIRARAVYFTRRQSEVLGLAQERALSVSKFLLMLQIAG